MVAGILPGAHARITSVRADEAVSFSRVAGNISETPRVPRCLDFG